MKQSFTAHELGLLNKAFMEAGSKEEKKNGDEKPKQYLIPQKEQITAFHIYEEMYKNTKKTEARDKDGVVIKDPEGEPIVAEYFVDGSMDLTVEQVDYILEKLNRDWTWADIRIVVPMRQKLTDIKSDFVKKKKD